MTLYVLSEPKARQPIVDIEFLRFKEYVYQRIVGRPIFSRECFKVPTVDADCFRWPCEYIENDTSGIDTLSLVFDTQISTLTYMHRSKKFVVSLVISPERLAGPATRSNHDFVFCLKRGIGGWAG